MGAVEDHRHAEAAHDRQRAEIADQGVVAEGGAALDQDQVAAALGAELGDDVGAVPGREELALLDADGATAARAGLDQVGLPAEQGRDLQEVDDRGDLGHLPGLVHVGGDRQAGGVLDPGEDAQALVQAVAAEARVAGAVGLVEAGLEHHREADLRGRRLDQARHLQRVPLALDHARAHDQQRQRPADDGAGAMVTGGMGFFGMGGEDNGR